MSADCSLVGNDLSCNIGTTSGVCAIADTVTKVYETAQASLIRRIASEAWTQGDNVVVASLTTLWEIGEGLSENSGGERANGDHGVLHLDDWVLIRRSR